MSVAPQIGRILAGKYRLDHVLGTGGMGTVVAATHLGLGRKVALKFMRLGVVEDAEAMGRFTREARAVATLRGEHVVQVMDVEVDAEDGAPYIVMEYLDGCDLATTLETRGALPAQDAVNYVLQACEGLAEAHAHGIVHRDLKPANLFLTRRPDGTPLVKVLDFGVSKLNEAAHSGSFRLTQPRRTLGSPQYMSPEQMIASPDVDARADIWALGVILYELLAGQRPFVAPSFLELSLAVSNRTHPPLGRRVPGLPPGLVAAIDRCLQKTPAARFSDVAALADVLAPHAGPGGDEAAARIARVLRVSQRTLEVNAPAPRARPRRRLVAIATVTVIGVGLAVAAGAVMWRSTPARAPERAAAPAGRPAAQPAAAQPTPAPAPPAPSKPAVAPAPPSPALGAVAAPASPPAREVVPAPAARRKRVRKADPAASEPPAEKTAAPPAPDDNATRTKRGPVIIGL